MNVIKALNFILALLAAYLGFNRFAGNNFGKKDEPEVLPIPSLYMDQLDSKSHDCVKRYELIDEVMMEEDGYDIYGSGVRNVPRGMLALSAVCREARTVGRQHASVSKIDDKYVIRVNDSQRMQLPNDERYYQELEIQDRMVVFLGLQPVRFVFVQRVREWNDRDGGINAKPPTRTKPVRGRKINRNI